MGRGKTSQNRVHRAVEQRKLIQNGSTGHVDNGFDEFAWIVKHHKLLIQIITPP